MDDRSTLRAAGAWLAVGSLLLVLTLAFHGPLHPDLQVQMERIAGSSMRWAVVHWTASVSLSCLVVAAILVLVARSSMTDTTATVSAWAVVAVGAVWTLTTAVVEVTVIADLAGAGDFGQFEAWWSFAQGSGNGFAALAIAVVVIAWNERRRAQPLVPKWSATLGAVSGLASFAGWALGVWIGIGPANLVWVIASAIMGAWLAWLGTALSGTSQGGS